MKHIVIALVFLFTVGVFSAQAEMNRNSLFTVAFGTFTPEGDIDYFDEGVTSKLELQATCLKLPH